MFEPGGNSIARLANRFTYQAIPTPTPTDPTPPPVGCADNTYLVSPSSNGVDASRRVYSVVVTAAAGCSWAAITESTSPWLRLVGGTDAGGGTSLTGTGTRTVEYEVQANDTGGTRTGRLRVHTQVVTITQADAAGSGPAPKQEQCDNGIDDDGDGQIDEGCAVCSYLLSSSGTGAPAGGVTSSLSVTVNKPVCVWTAVSEASFITITSAVATTGTGVVSFTVAANPLGEARSGILRIAGQPYTVTQGAECRYSISAGLLPSRAATTAVAVSTGSGCTWSAQVEGGIATIGGGGGGTTGNGTVLVRLPANRSSRPRAIGLVVGGQPFTVTQGPSVPTDLEGDGRGDFVVWRPGSGTWYSVKSGAGYDYAAVGVTQWGAEAAGDRPLMGDIDGDSIGDLVVWRASSGTWFWLTSSTGYSYAFARGKQWGQQSLGDVPMLADMDADGKADLVLWRASTGTWFWLSSSSDYDYASARAAQWGNASLGDVPKVGDMDGDGRGDLVIWRTSSGTWYWLTSSSGYAYAAAGARQWGNPTLGDIPKVGDMDGDGRADLIVWRAPSGTWYWLTSASGYDYAAARAQQWGNESLGDVPMLADLDGDGRSDLTVWRTSTGTWWGLTSSSGYLSGLTKQWGSSANRDIPMMK
jgi:hypothetical protein